MTILLTSHPDTYLDDTSALSSLTWLASAQSFKCNDDSRIFSAAMFLAKAGSPSGNIKYSLYAHSGTYGTSSVPTGAALVETGNLSTASLSASFTRFELSFSSYYSVASLTPLVLVVSYSGTSDGSNYIRVGMDSTNLSYTGNYADYPSSVWTPYTTHDLCFEIWGVIANPAITGVTSITGIHKITF